MDKFYTNVKVYGNNILHRYISDGQNFSEKVKYTPSIFKKTNKPSEYKLLDGTQVTKITFDSMNEAKEHLNVYKDVFNSNSYGNFKFEYTFLADTYENKVDFDINKISIVYLDIETASEDGYASVENPTEKITCIGLMVKNKKYIYSYGEYENNNEDVYYFDCGNEIKMLEKFLDFWTNLSPHIVSGWNVKFYDIPYLVNRIARVLGDEESKKLSFWKILKEKVEKKNNKDALYFDLYGTTVLDFMELYEKFMPKRDNLKLDHIAKVELDEEKIKYKGTLNDLYKNDFKTFIDYNIKDVELVFKLEKKLQLITIALTTCYDAKVNFSDVFMPTRVWDAIIFNYFKKHKLVFPEDKVGKKTDQYAGAYVKEVKPGLYDWIVSFDLNSLYPNLIAQFNISPETLLPQLFESDVSVVKNKPNGEVYYDVSSVIDQKLKFDVKRKDACLACNGHFFDNKKIGFLPDILLTMLEDRKVYKKKMIDYQKELETLDKSSDRYHEVEMLISKYDNFQQTKKIQLNSLYGALGTQYFRFYDIRLAEAVTLSGQAVIQKISNAINLYLNKVLKTENVDYVIAGDTDSVYITFKSLVEKYFENKLHEKIKIVNFLDKFCEDKIQNVIDTACKELNDYLCCRINTMRMKREAISDKGVWTAKKRYALNVYDSEGVRYSEPKIKIKGLEAIKSSTPEVCRNSIKNAISIIMNKDEASFQEYISEFKENFKNFPVENVAWPRGCNNIKKYTEENINSSSSSDYYKSGTPIQVRGAILYNQLLKQKKLTKKYEEIKEGSKVKYVYLKTPNPVGSNVISFIDEIPEEFNLSNYIDYTLQFEKAFLAPLKTVSDAIGWKTEYDNDLSFLF